MTQDKRPWFEKFFHDSPYIAYLEDSHKGDLAESLEFLTAKLGLGAGSIVFDQCCGTANISLAMIKQGMTVYGCDIAGRMVERANAGLTRIEAKNGSAFVIADACDYVCPEPADAAFNWFTSFGYGDDDENQRMLDCAYKSLKPGGRFAIDYPNTAVVLGKFRKSMAKTISTASGDLHVTRESAVDARHGRLMQTWTFAGEGGQESSFQGSMRIYLPSDLCAMLEEAGFADLELYGNTAGDWLSLETNRCIIVARK